MIGTSGLIAATLISTASLVSTASADPLDDMERLAGGTVMAGGAGGANATALSRPRRAARRYHCPFQRAQGQSNHHPHRHAHRPAVHSPGVDFYTNGVPHLRALEPILHPPIGRMFPVLDFDPVRAASGAVGAIRSLRHHALKPYVACGLEQVRADLACSNGATKMPSERRASTQTRASALARTGVSRCRFERVECAG